MENRYFWADSVEAKTHTLRVQHCCEICQACQRPRVLDGLMRSTPIPSAPMVSVAIDLFLCLAFFLKVKGTILWLFVWTGIQDRLLEFNV